MQGAIIKDNSVRVGPELSRPLHVLKDAGRVAVDVADSGIRVGEGQAKGANHANPGSMIRRYRHLLNLLGRGVHI